MTTQSMGVHRPVRVQDVVDQYLNKPYEPDIHVRLKPEQFGGDPLRINADMQKAFDNLPGDEWTIQYGSIVIKFKLLPTGYVMERRCKAQELATPPWKYSIRSAMDFLQTTLTQVKADFSRCESLLDTVTRRTARSKKAVDVLAQAQASFRTMVAFDSLVNSD